LAQRDGVRNGVEHIEPVNGDDSFAPVLCGISNSVCRPTDRRCAAIAHRISSHLHDSDTETHCLEPRRGIRGFPQGANRESKFRVSSLWNENDADVVGGGHEGFEPLILRLQQIHPGPVRFGLEERAFETLTILQARDGASVIDEKRDGLCLAVVDEQALATLGFDVGWPYAAEPCASWH
jgi:hypothetical protein